MQISYAEGSYIYDQNNKAYLDFVAGVSACSLGHRHPKVVSAVKAQLDKYLHVMVYGEYIQEPAVELTKLLPTVSTLIGIPTGGNNYAGAHSHPSESTYPLFSWSDIYTLFNLHLKAKTDVKNEVTLLLASKNHFLDAQVNLYALKVDNFSEFIATLNQDLNDIVNEDDKLDINASFSDKEDALNKKLGEEYKETDDNQQEKAFLEFFKKYGISLYKANDAIDNWSKIDLSAFTLNASGVVETPCE